MYLKKQVLFLFFRALMNKTGTHSMLTGAPLSFLQRLHHGDVPTKTAMNAAAFIANQHATVDRRPCWIWKSNTPLMKEVQHYANIKNQNITEFNIISKGLVIFVG